MRDKVIFLDANVYLRFYDTSGPKFKSLLKSIVEIREKIFITDQIRDEVNRNKLRVAINSFSAIFKELGKKKGHSLKILMDILTRKYRNGIRKEIR